LKTILALVALVGCGNVFAAGFSRYQPDTLHVYGSPNKTYRCAVYMANFRADGLGFYYAERCVLVKTDTEDHPPSNPNTIRVWLFMANQSPPNPPSIGFDCNFVDSWLLPGRRTETAIDCRPSR